MEFLMKGKIITQQQIDATKNFLDVLFFTDTVLSIKQFGEETYVRYTF